MGRETSFIPGAARTNFCEAANVEATQTIDIMHFVDGSEIDIAYYDTPYYTEPSNAGRKAYALLRDAAYASMSRSDRARSHVREGRRQPGRRDAEDGRGRGHGGP